MNVSAQALYDATIPADELLLVEATGESLDSGLLSCVDAELLQESDGTSTGEASINASANLVFVVQAESLGSGAFTANATLFVGTEAFAETSDSFFADANLGFVTPEGGGFNAGSEVDMGHFELQSNVDLPGTYYVLLWDPDHIFHVWNVADAEFQPYDEAQLPEYAIPTITRTGTGRLEAIPPDDLPPGIYSVEWREQVGGQPAPLPTDIKLGFTHHRTTAVGDPELFWEDLATAKRGTIGGVANVFADYAMRHDMCEVERKTPPDSSIPVHSLYMAVQRSTGREVVVGPDAQGRYRQPVPRACDPNRVAGYVELVTINGRIVERGGVTREPGEACTIADLATKSINCGSCE